ncbi:hypothetical protein GCM10010182_70680 [Actinomadura cremea]|nr:hypothetical protein GCM10010182_70680 [Actinomadura cremea]
MEIEEAVRRPGLADDYRDPQRRTATQAADRTVRKADPAWLEELLTAMLQVPEPTCPMRYCFEAAFASRRYCGGWRPAPGGAERSGASTGSSPAPGPGIARRLGPSPAQPR